MARPKRAATLDEVVERFPGALHAIRDAVRHFPFDSDSPPSAVVRDLVASLLGRLSLAAHRRRLAMLLGIRLVAPPGRASASFATSTQAAASHVTAADTARSRRGRGVQPVSPSAPSTPPRHGLVRRRYPWPVPKPVVAVLDLYPPEVRAAIAAEAPARIELRMAESREPDALAALAAGAEFFVGGVEAIPGELIEAAPRLRLIHKWGIGVDKIDLAAARRRGVPVAFTYGSNAVPVAEHTLLLLLALLKRLPERSAQLEAGKWWEARAAARTEALQLRGRTVGLVGLGAVGREVARRVRAFDARVVYHDVRRPSSDEEEALGVAYRDLDALLGEVDVVSLHAPYLASTHHLLSKERIARLKRGAIVINCARGELIDELALANALESGHLGGAGIDVFAGEPPSADSPLLKCRAPGLILTPHIAGSAWDNVASTARQIFRNVERALDGEPIPERELVR